MKAPITPAQAWAALVEHYGWAGGKAELPVLPDHPEPRTMKWSALEKLARLGNGEQYGNSDGNMIARDALSKYKGAK